MAVRQIQSVFSLGELDPKLLARTDFAGYYKGAFKLRDMLSIPQGGCKRRFGTSFNKIMVDTQNSNAPVTDEDEVNLFEYNFSGDKVFSVAVRPDNRGATEKVAFEIFLNDVIQTTVKTANYSFSQIKDLYFIGSNSRIIILHPDVKPHELVRITDSNWSIAAIDFGYLPVYDYSIIDGTSYRGGSDTFTPSATSGSGITLTGSSSFFTAGHVGGIYIGGGGVFRITSVNTAGTVATGDTIEPFDSTTAIKGINSVLTEALWGDYSGGTPSGKDRGWPSRGAFIQNRLVLGRQPLVKNLLAASNSGDFYNFDDSEGTDLNAFSYQVSDDIVDIIGNKALIVLTASTVESSSIFLEAPITPSNIFLTVQSFHGADEVKAQIIDNVGVFVDRNQRQINAIEYDINNGSFNVSNASVLSSHLIRQPVSMAAWRPATDDGEILLAANEDGTMAILQSLRAENVQGWTLAGTRGHFFKVSASSNSAHALVKRNINTGTTVSGDADNVFRANDAFEGIIDITEEAAASSTNVSLFESEGDYVVIGHQIPFNRIEVTLDTQANATVSPTFEYLNAQGQWTSFTPTSDGTSGFTADGVIVWSLENDVGDWKAQTFPTPLAEGVIEAPQTKFWMRIQRGAASLSQEPIEETLQINVASRIMFESLDFDALMDSSESTSSNASGVVTGLDHLTGLQVYALVDGIPEGPFFVNDSSEITVEGQSDDVSVGINFTPTLVPMPLVVNLEFGQSVYQPKHLKSINIDYYESLGILVNGQEIPSLSIGSLILDQKPIPETNFYEITPMRGWDPRSQNTISQDLPLPMTILGIGYRLEVS